MYLTPDRFRSMGMGLDLDAIEDAEFAFIMERASSQIDAYCAVPMLPTKHDFRGGSVTAEKHRWRLPDLTLSSEIGSRRVYPFHKPISSVEKFVVKFTNTYSVEVAPSNLYINESEGWAEVVSLAAVVSGVYPVGVNFGLYTPVAEIDYTYGWSFSSVGERIYATDAYTYRAANQFWKSSPVPTVKLNGATQSSGYTVDFTEGTVTFGTARAADDAVTVTYDYSLPPAIRDACAFIAADMLGEADLHQRGMGELGMVRIAELEMRREDAFGRGFRQESSVSAEAATLLEPFRYVTAR